MVKGGPLSCLGRLNQRRMRIRFVGVVIRVKGHRTNPVDAGVLEKPFTGSDMTMEELGESNSVRIKEIQWKAQKASTRKQFI